MYRASRLETADFLEVKKCSSSEVVGVLTEEFEEPDLLLTYGPTNDEQALARDIRKAAASDRAAQQDIRQRPVFNMFEACKRLKMAHDGKVDVTDAAKMHKRCTLDAMHTHFVASSGRRFVSPTPDRESSLMLTQLYDLQPVLDLTASQLLGQLPV